METSIEDNQIVENGEPASTNENTINIEVLCGIGAMSNIEKVNFIVAWPL